MDRLDDKNAIEITDDIWWVGFADYEAGFSNNPYLLVDGEEGVFFDPGPGHPVFRDMILNKIGQVIDPERIKYIVVHHQDPDLCGLIPFLENVLHPDVTIIAHPRTALFIPYYGVRRNILPVGDGDVLQLRSGRTITFYHTPYVHFAGSMVTYDDKTASLFSSDLFAVFNREWSLYADESYIELARTFIEYYVEGRESLRYAYDKLKRLTIRTILPQHGGIIRENIDRFLNILKEAEPGRMLRELERKPSPDQEKELVRVGNAWLKFWLHKDIKADSLNDMMDMAVQEGPSTISVLLDVITTRASDLGVANPLTFGKLHRWDSIQSVKSIQIVDSIRRRFLSNQYSMMHGNDVSSGVMQGLESFKTSVAVMFVDIREFTAWSSRRNVDEVVSMLNRQLELISKIINSNGGRVNKILGDGILAYFHEQKLPRIITIARMIHEAIRENMLLDVGIGCDYGEVIMGDLGEENRLDYTLIGPVVNFASRMCDSAGKGEVAMTVRLYEKLKRESGDSAVPNSVERIKVRMKVSDPEIEGVKFSITFPV
jgi:class 3 adenylate cyclase